MEEKEQKTPILEERGDSEPVVQETVPTENDLENTEAVDEQQEKERANIREFTRVSDEELDRIADTTIATLREILKLFNAEDSVIDEYEGDEGELILDVLGNDLAILIGRYGKTLDALQYLVASIVNKKIGYRYPIAIDIEGYRNRRRQKLESLAKSAATRCIRNKAEVRLRPMTAYERRIVHIILREERRVLTVSEGEDPHRQVVVKPR